MPCICLLAAFIATQIPFSGSGLISNQAPPAYAPARPPVAPEPHRPVFGMSSEVSLGKTRKQGTITVGWACGRKEDEGAIIRLDEGAGRPTRLRFGLELAKSLGDPLRLIGVKATVIGKVDNQGTMEVESLAPDNPGQLSQSLDARMGFQPSKVGDRHALISGTHRYVTILVRYSDTVGITPFTSTFIQNLYTSTFPGLDHYFKELSYNQFSIAGSDVVGWINLSHPQSYYSSSTTGWGVDWDKITADAIAAADSQVDYKNYYGINIIPNVLMGNIGGLGGQRQLTLDGATRLWGTTYDNPQNNMHVLLGHEMGHTIGFPHSSGPYTQTYDSLWDVMSNGSLPNGSPTYGPLACPTISYHREKVDWISGTRLYEALPGTDKTLRIERLSNPTNTTDALMAKVYINGSATHYFSVEARRYGGNYEAAASLPAEGILIHDVDENRIVTDPFTGTTVQGRNAEVVDVDNNGNCNDAGAIWTAGETFTDAPSGVSVAVTAADATGYTVRIKVDAAKPNPYDVVNTNDNGPGSLRNALYWAQKHPGSRTKFKLSTSDPNYAGGVFRIHALTNFPDVSASNTIIDGTDQTALTGNTNAQGPEIYLDGSGTADGYTGLWISGSNVTLRGVAVGGWGGQGVVLDGAKNGQGAVVAGNYLGLDPNGITAAPNKWPAAVVYNGYKNSTFGGTTAADRNVISGGTSCGILLQNPGTDGCVIKGNYFGVTADGTTKLGNGDWNIAVLSGTTNVTIGGSAIGEGNVISGDTGVGIGISDAGSSGVTIKGNRIGTNAAGTAAIGNEIGVFARNGASNIVVGGSAAGEGNLISGNVFDGISFRGITGAKIFGNRIGTNATGTAALPNSGWGISLIQAATNCQVGGTNAGEGNLISGNQFVGVGIGNAGSTGNKVLGNFIGTNAAGDGGLAQGIGIYIFDAGSSNTIGGATTASRNLVSGHTNNGIQVNDNTCDGNVIQGNYVGTTVNGNAAITSAGWGMYVAGKNTTILGNVVSGNSSVGIGLGNGATTNSVRGNIVGLGANGSTVVANGNIGIYIYGGSPNNTVGGTTAADRNLVASNLNSGLLITGAGSDGNKVLGNYLGMTADGMAARPNFFDGIAIANGAKNNIVGGTLSNGSNVIASSGNMSNASGAGIACYDAGTTGNVITGNIIGTAAGASPDFGCGWCGIALSNGASNNTIGGIGAGLGNQVFGNGSGVYVNSTTTIGNAIRGNAIGSNKFLGIDLNAANGSFNVSANDTGDVDTGPNNLQNFPVLTSGTNLNGSTTIQGTLNSKPNQTYNLDFYASVTADASQYGEGEVYLGSKSVTTDATGNASFSVAVAHTSGANLSATATSSTGDTSEFSKTLNISISNNLPISGAVSLQDFAGPLEGVVTAIEIRQPGSSTALVTKQVTLTSTGTFSFNAAIPAGTYDITFKASHWLRKKTVNVTLTSSGVSGLSFTLRNGDVNGDNKVDASDQTALTTAFRSKSTSPNWNPNADLNGDGQVSASDQAILGKNFGATGD